MVEYQKPIIDNVYPYTKKDGTTLYRIRHKNPITGKSETRTVVPPEGEQSGRKLIEFLTIEKTKFFKEQKQGLSASDSKMTMKQYFDGPYKIQFSGRDKTWHDYQGLYNRHIDRYLGTIKMCDMNRNMMQSFFKYLDEKGDIGNSTFNAILRLLNAVFNCAVADGVIVSNPLGLRAVKKKEVDPEVGVLSPNELDSLVQFLEMEDPFWRTLFMTMICTGCRRGEVVALCW